MSKHPPLIEIQDLTKVYLMGEVEVHALRGLSLQIHKGELVSIMGPSGSGKTTLMNVIGCLDQPTSGTYFLEGTDVAHLDDDRLAEIRNRKIGFPPASHRRAGSGRTGGSLAPPAQRAFRWAAAAGGHRPIAGQ
jgi:predicted ABC-type transport system involved in lysophospholipase L1 biosynthesis ATPase subunit